MTEQDDDAAIRDLIRRAYDTDTEIYLAESLADIRRRASGDEASRRALLQRLAAALNALARTSHAPTINRSPYFSTPWVYWAYCSCGRYKSNKFADDRAAWRAWYDHTTHSPIRRRKRG